MIVWDELIKQLTFQFIGATTLPKEEITPYKTDVVAIIIQNGFTKIPYGCFINCVSLTTISFPYSIEIFEDNIIQNTNVKEVHIPLNTATINAGNPFDMTKSTLSRFTINPSNKYFTVIDDVLYTKDLKRIIAYPPAKQQKTFMIPNGVKIIGSTAFETSIILQNLIIPPSVTSIGGYFCRSMKALKSVIFLHHEITDEIAKSRVTIDRTSLFQGSTFNESDIEWIFLPKLKSCPIIFEKNSLIHNQFNYVFLFCLFL